MNQRSYASPAAPARVCFGEGQSFACELAQSNFDLRRKVFFDGGKLMKRITMIFLATMTFALLLYTQNRTTISPLMKAQAAQASRDAPVTTAMWKEYEQLLKSKSGEASVRSWARRNKLQIVSQKGYEVTVIPEQRPTTDPGPQELGACDARKCPTANAAYPVTNSLGQMVGYQYMKCTAGSCKWVKDSEGRWNRICGNWKCSDSKRESFPS